jgi:phosphatidylinositol alpha-1,6-mannosyltransferase
MANNYIFCFLEIFANGGGIQSYIKDLLQAYSSLGENLPKAQILLLRDPPQSALNYQSNNLEFYYFQNKFTWLGRIKLTLTLLQLIIKDRPKRVFCGHINLAPLVQMLCQPLGIPYTIFTYGKEAWDPLPAPHRKALHSADQIITISRYTRDRTCEQQGVKPEKFTLLPCMVDGTIFTPGIKPSNLITKYNLVDAKILITVARLCPGDEYKGIDITIRALPRIAEVFPNVKYVIIGKGEDHHRLRKIAAELGVEKRVIFAGFIPPSELVEHYRLSNAYIMPSQEGFGIAYLEAMACGIPVLAGDIDGSADPLQDGKLGWRVAFRNPQAVAEGCIEILENQEKAQPDIRCNGNWLRQQTLAVFGRENFVQNVYKLFQL